MLSLSGLTASKQDCCASCKEAVNIGFQRLASRMGDGTAALFEGKTSDTRNLKADQQTDLQNYATLLGVKEVNYKATPDYQAAKGDELEVVIYYYHPDHLGSNTFVTDMVGLPYQMFVNLPFGEMMAEQTSTGYFQNPYKFNGKSQRSEDPDPSGELDEETGLYYYGARYYDPRGSLWLGVDPLASKYPSISSYAYCANNPINAIDPDGRYIIFIGGLRLWHGARDQAGHSYNGMGGKTGIYKSDVFDNYWSTDRNTFGRTDVDIAGYFIEKYKDENIGFTSGSSFWNSQASDRRLEGMEKAKLFHQMVQNGDITLEAGETIKVISHSQGGAHAAGFIEQLQSYTNADGNPLYKIEVAEYITPHQPTDINHPSSVPGIQYSHENDQVSSRNYLPNGGTKFGKINGILNVNFHHGNIMGGSGQPKANILTRGGHNVTDNDKFIKRGEQ